MMNEEIENTLTRIENLLTLLTGKVTTWLDIRSAAQYLNISERQCRRLISDGRIKSKKVSGVGVRIHRSDLEAYVRFDKSWDRLTRPQKAMILEARDA